MFQVEYLYISPTLASVLAFIPSFFLSYTLAYRWVFLSRHDKNVWAIYKYTTVVAIGFIWNMSIMYITTEMFEWWYVYSQALVFIVVGVNNFLLNMFWVFKKNEE